jgi:hypothetical protein
MEGVKKSLQVTLENCEFAKEFHYFVTVQLDGEGEKVSVSAVTTVRVSIATDRHICRGDQPDILCQHFLPADVSDDADVRKSKAVVRVLRSHGPPGGGRRDGEQGAGEATW